MSVVAPAVPSTNNYAKSTPTVVWDKKNGLFAFALPPACEDHPSTRCLCWVGPFIHDAAKDYDGAKLSTRKLFKAYLLCMKGNANMEDVEDVASSHGSDGMDLDPPINDPVVPNSDLFGGSYKFVGNSNHFNDNDADPNQHSPSVSHRSSSSTVPASSTARDDTPLQVTRRAAPSPSMPKPASPAASPPQLAKSTPDPAESPHPAVPQSDKSQPSTNGVPSKTWQSRLPAIDEDAALDAMQTLIAAYKEQKGALHDAHLIMGDLQKEVDRLTVERRQLDIEINVLRIDAATHGARIAELMELGAQKDYTIAELQREVVEMQETDAALEEILRARKRPHV
ncbi:hypothetical protein B0H16DRAFT_1740060 [Mycena metata]|uniref:Uncharacterized protein n=1 Tax=Mycena metata TaxID=1033252 RepID=A0AAD7HEL5_9AGAR|nr:hypothetical protein B0H16DRAFT_1740060 [Mycena metata]